MKTALSTAKPSPLATPTLGDCFTITCRATHDSTERDTLLLGDEAALYADAANSSGATRAKLGRFGIKDQVQRKGHRGHPISEADKARNAKIAVTRAGANKAHGAGQKPNLLRPSRHCPQYPERR